MSTATLANTLHYSVEAMSTDNNYEHDGGSSTSVSEITEEELENSSHFYFNDAPNIVPMSTISEENEDNIVYVAVGKSETSMEALSWTLNNLVTPSSSTLLYLIHVFPLIKHIPNPLGVGMVPKDQVSAEQVESYMAQERGKRRELLNKFIQSCSASKVKVDTILIESDFIAKAIIDLIPILQMKKLVIGANKSLLRKLRSRKGNSMADQVLQNAPESCEVRVICEGKEVNEEIARFILNDTSMSQKKDQQNDGVSSLSCVCFNFKA